jgi:trimeric autotransporter adhesin
MVSPISGTVGALTIKVGQSVSASAAAQITVLGPGSEQVTISVGDLAVGQIQVGAAAAVTPSGSTAPLPGTVTSVGVKNTSTGSAPSYPVVIGLTGTPPQLPDGQGATVSIVTAKVDGVVAVPTSAVRPAGATHTVTLLVDGTPRPTPVRIGAVGPDLTQIVSGVQPGQQVVLADLSQPLPSATTGTRGGTGGFGGGGGPGGGGAGGRPGG